MTLIYSAPERLAMMLTDSNDNIVVSYHTHQDDIDFPERPAYIIRWGDADYSVDDETSVNQASVNESCEINLVGEPYKGTEQDYGNYFELQTRQIAFDAVVYLLRHPNMQFSNRRGLRDRALPDLPGVMWMRITNLSRVQLMTREGLENPFWGFTMSLDIRSMLPVDEDEVVIVPQ